VVRRLPAVGQPAAVEHFFLQRLHVVTQPVELVSQVLDAANAIRDIGTIRHTGRIMCKDRLLSRASWLEPRLRQACPSDGGAATWRWAWDPPAIRQLAAVEHVAPGGLDVLTKLIELVV
jgi:hypothetical protein